MEIIKLSKRLQTLASFVPNGAKVADIGTDHGYIPVWLAQNRITDKIAAADINIGPLEHAKATAHEYGVFDQIKFELCSGLSFENSSDYDTIIIAGMGGELIMSIIEAAPWTKNGTTLILQPNSKIQDLVQWLTENEYSIKETRLVKDAGKYYQILIVSHGKDKILEREAHRLVHPLYLTHKDPLTPEYLDNLISRYKHAIDGMLTSKKETPELTRLRNLVEDLQSMKKETETWQQ